MVVEGCVVCGFRHKETIMCLLGLENHAFTLDFLLYFQYNNAVIET